MKKIIIILVLITSFLIYENNKEEIIIPNNALRLRVIPNSNSALDQNIKGQIRTYLEDNTYNLVKDEKDINSARKKIKENIPNIEDNINKIFKENNYQKTFDVNYGYNYFPEKKYRGLKYEEGYYESLVISIGEAKGDNYWCVLFPNLCLVDLEKNSDKEYKSWVLEKLSNIK